NLDQKEALIRIQCWREGGRGYKPVSSKMSWMIQAEEIKNSYEPLKLITAETRCIPSQALERGFKLSNGLNYIKAAQEAQNRNADDALMLTMTDFISETTSANIFWLHDEAVFTPSEKCDLLPGITRKLVADVLLRNDVKLEKGEFSIAHIRQAEAAFCCNSVREIQEVASIDEKDMEIGHPLVKKIMVLFEKYKFELLNR
ncbi:MAG: aminotransferase class IV, partial [Balneolaceae bacterium]